MLLLLALAVSPPAPSPAPPVVRLLIEGVQHQPDGGYRVTLVQPDSPTRKMTRVDDPSVPGELEVGDVITKLNGQPLPTPASLGQLLQAAGGKAVTLTVVDRRTGAAIDWRVTPTRGGGPAPASGGVKVHALLVGDTLDRTVGVGCGVDVRTLTAVLTGGGHVHPSRVGTVTTLTGGQATADNILKAVTALPSRSQDTVLVYVSSHGAFDPTVADPLSGGHFLALRARGGKDLPRVDVRKALADRPGRLKLLVTDACNTKATIVRPPPVGAAPAPTAPAAPPAPKPKVVTPVEKLLFAHAGRLDMTAASPGESATGTDEAGGVFTLALVHAMTREAGWPAVLKETTAEAKRGYQGKPQTAKVFENTLRPENPPGGLPPLLEAPGEWGLPSWWGR